MLLAALIQFLGTRNLSLLFRTDGTPYLQPQAAPQPPPQPQPQPRPPLPRLPPLPTLPDGNMDFGNFAPILPPRVLVPSPGPGPAPQPVQAAGDQPPRGGGQPPRGGDQGDGEGSGDASSVSESTIPDN